MLRATALLLAVPITLAACSSGKGQPAAAPIRTVTVTPSPTPTLDNYAQIACGDIDKALAEEKKSQDEFDPLSNDQSQNGLVQSQQDDQQSRADYSTAIAAASKSAADGFTAQMATYGADVPVDTSVPSRFQPALDSWRSFCESKGWVGTN